MQVIIPTRKMICPPMEATPFEGTMSLIRTIIGNFQAKRWTVEFLNPVELALAVASTNRTCFLIREPSEHMMCVPAMSASEIGHIFEKF